MSTFRVIVVAAFTLILGAASSQEYAWLNVQQEVIIRSSGVIEVVDERTLIRRGGTYLETFICFEHASGVVLTMREDTGPVEDGPEATAFQQPCLDGPGTELVIRNSEPISSRRFRFSYLVHGPLHRDRQYDLMRFTLHTIMASRPTIQKFSLSVSTPADVAAPYSVYVGVGTHDSDKEWTPLEFKSGNRASFTIDEKIIDGVVVVLDARLNPEHFDEQVYSLLREQ